MSRSGFAYYNYQILMAKRGRLDLNSPLKDDLAKYQNKWYMVWGPAPILFILPFYLIWKIETSDVVYTLVAGLINIVLVYLLINEFEKVFKIHLSRLKRILLLVGFALVTPNFILSLKGEIWFTSQIIGTFYLLMSYLLLGKWLNNKHLSLKYILFSYAFFLFSVWTRFTVAFQGVVFLYPLYLLWQKKNFIVFKKVVIIIISLTFIWLTFFALYNYARFKDPLETGLRYQIGNIRYDKDIKNNQIFSIKNIPQNISLYFFHHAFPVFKYPYISYDFEGNSLISVYPIVVLFLGILSKKIYRSSSHQLIILSILGIILNFLFILTTLFSGWIQFGLRFVLDVIPLFVILLIPIVANLPPLYLLLPTVYGMFIQLTGAWAHFMARK